MIMFADDDDKEADISEVDSGDNGDGDDGDVGGDEDATARGEDDEDDEGVHTLKRRRVPVLQKEEDYKPDEKIVVELEVVDNLEKAANADKQEQEMQAPVGEEEDEDGYEEVRFFACFIAKFRYCYCSISAIS